MMFTVVRRSYLRKLIDNSKDLNAISYSAAELLGLVTGGETYRDSPIRLQLMLIRMVLDLQRENLQLKRELRDEREDGTVDLKPPSE